MKLRLATADFTFPLLEHDRVLDLVAMLDFDGIDIGLFEGRSHLWPSKEFANVATSARTLRRKLRNRGLKPADVFLQMAPDFVPLAANHPAPARRRKARDWFVKTLEYACECGCEHVTVLPGVHFENEPLADSWNRCVEELAWRVDRAAAAGIIFGVEPHLGSIAPTPRTALALLRQTPGLTLTLDYTHFTYRGIADQQVEPLLAFATHFHVRGGRRRRLQVGFADNIIDYGRIVDLMRKRDYRGWFGIEYVWTEWQRANECDTMSETIQFRNWFDGLRSTSRRRRGSRAKSS